MKISFNSTIFSQEKTGGISRYFICLMKGLIENNINIEIVSFLHKNIFLKSFPKKNSIGYYLSNYPSFKLIEKLNNYKFNQYNKKNSVDIIHDTYYTLNIKKIKNIKKVITVHDLIHEKFSTLYRDSEYLINLKKKSFEDTDYFICVSENTKKDLIEYYNIKSDKISVVYHGADHILNKNLKPKSEINIPYLLYVGNRERYKNFNLLLKAFSKSIKIKNNFKLICFGGGKFNKREIKLINELNLSKNILFRSGSDQLLCNFYINAKAIIIPSLYEGFGLPIIEAMRLNCPIFCSNIDVFREIAGSYVTYFEPTSEEDLIFQLESKIFNDNELQNLTSKAFEFSKKFSWQKNTNDTIEIYKKLI